MRFFSLVLLIVVLTCCSVLVPPAWSQGPPDIQLTAAAATILYFPFKATFALGGGIVGGLAYVLSGFCETTANSIWIPTMYGTYILTPQHLSRDRPIRFVGVEAEID
ncbi:MAG: hypothetical protein NDI90_08345 [Nitrospira sp. BO4]|jgi:hypothetical protein|nr:hypothetical protein [Nitrospira sp. BO4]